MKLPDFLAGLFRNYVFTSLDDEQHCELVVKTVLAYGEWEQILWLFRRYGRARVGEIFLKDYYGLRSLPEATLRLWELVFVPHPPPEGGRDPVARWRGRRRVPVSLTGPGKSEGPR